MFVTIRSYSSKRNSLSRSSQVFNHHLSLIEEHLRFIELARKHVTSEGDGSQAIRILIERTQAMLQESRQTQQKLVSGPFIVTGLY